MRDDWYQTIPTETETLAPFSDEWLKLDMERERLHRKGEVVDAVVFGIGLAVMACAVIAALYVRTH